MHNKLRDIFKSFIEDEANLDKIIVSLFVRKNNIKVRKNKLLLSLILEEGSALYESVSTLMIPFTFDDMIEAFEKIVPQKERVINGAVYTPNYIKEFIVEHSLNKVDKPLRNILAADISCGCGAFLYSLTKMIRSKTGKSYRRIFSENVFGLDISASSIKRAEILLSMLAVADGEDDIAYSFNLYTANALVFDWLKNVESVRSNNGFDAIVGNPPYVRAKNINEETKKMLTKWSVTKSGNPDLYIPFIEIGLKNLHAEGMLGYITANTFYQSVNARLLRKYLQENIFSVNIIDFGHERIFGAKSTYTCILLISKKPSPDLLFKKETSLSLKKNGTKSFSHIHYNSLTPHKGWLLNDKGILENIKRIEGTGKTLGEKFKIKNGIATLSNDIYIFKPVEETANHYILLQKGRRYKIEKSICKDIIKPNILKYESEINDLKEKLIYPYTNGTSPLMVMKEQVLKKDFPNAYKYLADNKQNLSLRDKGNGDYGAWYAFGRTQALTDKGYKLMFPYIGKKSHFVFTDNQDMLIYCGYAIFDKSPDQLKILKKILESSVFEYYIAHTSKPYSAGYFSYAKNYVKNFGICDLTEEEGDMLKNNTSMKEINNWLIEKYQIDI